MFDTNNNKIEIVSVRLNDENIFNIKDEKLYNDDQWFFVFMRRFILISLVILYIGFR